MKKSVWTQAKKERVQEAVDYWLDALALKPFRVNYVFHDKEDPENENTQMSIHCATPYRSARINVYPEMATAPIESVNSASCHEVTHVLLDFLDSARLHADDLWRNEVERITDHLSMCMDDLARRLGKAQDTIADLKKPSRRKRG